ncbi:MAG: phosphatidate cytidylyltransferase [Candidatus Cloacimonetes bacterium]|nr:phosphatidate cytidylyltransferase [Candidatus Cloacimonadota bacterium]
MELIKRFLIAIIFIPLLLAIFYLGGFSITAFFGMVVVIQHYEMREMFLSRHVILPKVILLLGASVYLAAALFDLQTTMLAITVTFIIILGNDLFTHDYHGAIQRISASLFMVIYSGLFSSTIVRIRSLPDGRFLIIALLSIIWITDSGAYFIGMRFGKHRGVFKASPSKSIEGFLAGFVFALISGLATWFIFHRSLWVGFSLAVSVGIFGQLGDLMESVLKRDFGVKDSSQLLPGHGGLLDRFDSLLLAAPVFYLLQGLFF